MPRRSTSLFFTVARPDAAFMHRTIPHLVRGCRHPFLERTIVIDTAPLPKRYAADPNVPSMEDVRVICSRLVKDGLIDRVLEVDYTPPIREGIYRKHYSKVPRHDHDFRGGPVYPYLYALERIPGKYIAHFDADMMLHQPVGRDWITEGIELMRQHEDIVCVCPHPGPPRHDGSIDQPNNEYARDPRGFFRFSRFTARRFLLNRVRYEALLPLQLHAVSRRHAVKSALLGMPADQTWEMLVSEALERTGKIRADLLDGAWTLHPLVRGQQFQAFLADILQRIEAGDHPAGQEGRYDLEFDLWTKSR